jgi:GT2 family glycosyltransferase
MTDVTVVIATRDRRDRLLRTLDQLAALPEAPPVIVVDNGSSDDSSDAVRRRADARAGLELVALPENRGAPARTVGVERARTPYVAFADDDSGWMPGALTRATAHLDAHPRLGLLAATVLVEVGSAGERRPDPVSVAMAASPLASSRPLPGPPVLGFMACGAVVRREAYLQVGGFSPVLFFVGEERLLAIDLVAAGWDVAHAPDVEAIHEPAHRGVDRARQALAMRNDLLVEWMRRPLPVALRSSGALAARALRDPVARAGLTGALRRAPAALRRRHTLPPEIEHQIRLLESA